MKKMIKYSVSLFLILCTITIYPQDKKSYKWTGDWESIPGDCPQYCIQRKFVIERKGKPDVKGNIIRSDLNMNGTRIQFITMGRYYLWIKDLLYLSLTGKNGYVLDDARQIPDAVRIVMDDAVNNYLQWEETTAVKTDNNKSSTSASTLNSLANAGKDWEKQKKDAYNNLLASAEKNILRKDYDKALLDVKLALLYGSTPEVYATEKRINQLIKERDEKAAKEKKEKSKAEAKAEKLKKEKKKAPDKKILFAGNPGYKPYPNPYDNPDPAKSVKTNPRYWKDYPENIKDESALKKMYEDAVRGHDGYRLIQLAMYRFNTGINFAPRDELLKQVYEVARFNRDPWLMLYLLEFYNQIYRNNPAEKFLPNNPSFYAREVYSISVLRNDPEPLETLYLIEKSYDLIPDMTEKDINKTRYEMTQ